MKPHLAATALTVLFAAVGACKSKTPEGEASASAGNENGGDKTAVTAATETALPEARPTPFAVNYQIERAIDARDSLKLGDDVSRLGTTRGRRLFNAAFASEASELDRVHKVLWANACDRIKTKVERSTDTTGTILQLHVGRLRHVANDRGQFFPAPEWADSYKACATAMDEAFPTVGEAPHTSFEVRYPSGAMPVPLVTSVDLGPDFLGVAWDDSQTKVSVDVATIRPVEIVARSGPTEERTLLDLSKHVAVVVAYTGTPKTDDFRVTLELVEGEVHRHGEVANGVDTRAEPKRPPATPREDAPAEAKDGAKADLESDAKPGAKAGAEPDKTAAGSPEKPED